MHKEALIMAVQAAIAGDWQQSHNIAQDYSDSTANWIHAVLHKIEGDQFNSNYWYARTDIDGAGGKKYDDFSNANAELTAILQQLTA